MKRAALIYALLLFFGFQLKAQELKEVEVFGDRIHWSEGALIRDTNRINFNSVAGDILTEELQMKSSLWIRTTAPGSYSQISYRGLSGNHTQVLWEGLPVNSPALGVTDLSSMSAGAIGQISFGTGGSLGFQSGNSAGGVLQLSEGPLSERPLFYAGISYSSFNSRLIESGATWKSTKHSHSLRFSYLDSDNNYDFTSPRGEVLSRQGADYKQLLAKYNYVLEFENGVLDLAVWAQNQDVGIVNNILQTEQLQRQTDVFLRQFIRFRSRNYTLQAGWFYEEGDYVNPVSGIYDFNAAHTGMAKGLWRFRPKKNFIFTTESDFLYTSIWGLNKSGKRSQWINSAHIQWIAKKKLTVDLGGRLDIASDGQPMAGLNAKVEYELPYSNIFLRADQVNRRPNLNDLYWFNGGNPNLKGESGISLEAGLIESLKIQRTKIDVHFSAFGYNIEGLIIWLPGDNGIWSPVNVNQGQGQGVETGGNIAHRHKDWTISAGADYQYVWSEQRSGGGYYLSPGVPVHRLRINASIGFRNTHLRLAGQETSDWNQFQDGGQLGELIGLSVYNLTISQKMRAKRNAILASFIVRNVFDQEYSYQPFMPMPGLNFSFRILYELESKTKSQPETTTENE